MTTIAAQKKTVTTQSSGAAFLIVDKILEDIRHRKGLRHAWDEIDEDVQAEIKHEWALQITAFLNLQSEIIRHKLTQEKKPKRDVCVGGVNPAACPDRPECGCNDD